MQDKKKKLVLKLMELSDPPAWKWFKLYETYEGMSVKRLEEIKGGFGLAEKGLKRREQRRKENERQIG